MRIESKLCHVSESRSIVQVTGWADEKNLGSALAEGATVEVAEDKAIYRLNNRINLLLNDGSKINSTNEEEVKPHLNAELSLSVNKNINNEPSDWSNELTAIDTEIERLKWSRDDENKFLAKNLGYNKRNEITKYNDIVNYLNLLKNISLQSQSNKIKKGISALIEESDIIIKELSWDHVKGRDFLRKEFNVSTRKELNEEQLISFITKLKLVKKQFLNK